MRKVFLCVLAPLACLLLSADLRAQILHYQQVVNNTGAPRDDLHVVVSQVVTGKFTAPPFTRQSLTQGLPPGSAGKEMDFDQGVVNPGELAGVRWVNAFKADMILDGYWTLGGVRKEPIKTNPVRIQPNVLLDGRVTLAFQNTSLTPVPYTGLSVVNGADIGSLDLDNFVLGMATGTPVETIIPVNGTLPPGTTDVATFPASNNAYMACFIIVDGTEAAVGWTVPRIGSTSFNFLPGSSNDRTFASVLGTFNNVYVMGGTQASAPFGQISGGIWALNNFGAPNFDFAGGSLTDNIGVGTNDFFNTGTVLRSASGDAVVGAGGSCSADFSACGFLAFKYDELGNRDPLFGDAGAILFQFGPFSRDQANAVLQLPALGLLFAGETCSGPTCQNAFVRTSPGGTVLSSIRDTNGKGILDLAPGPNNTIWTLLRNDNAMGRQAYSLARYNSVLTLDPSFGVKNYNFDPNSIDEPTKVIYDATSHIVKIIGTTRAPGASGSDGFVLAVDDAVGLPVPSFGTDGKLKLSFGVSTELHGLALDNAAGKVIVVGAVKPSPPAPFNGLVGRLSSTGGVETTFRFSLPGSNVVFTSVSLEPFTGNVYATGFQIDMMGNGTFLGVKVGSVLDRLVLQLADWGNFPP